MDKKRKKQYILIFTLIGVILIIDQLVKIMVKTHMHIGEEIPLIGNWALLHFTENEGFAFGMHLGGDLGKIILSLFRIIASGVIFWYLLRQIKKGIRTSLAVCITLIFVGALGNVIDSCFYGLIFNESYYNVAQLFPPEGGYAPFLQGRVVDMFYFPIIDTTWPSWMPIWGGQRFLFFSAIFNVADASITIGTFWIIIDLFITSRKKKSENKDNSETEVKKVEE